MKKIRTLSMIITFWILIIILSSSWLIHLFVDNLQLAKTNIFFTMILIISLVSFLLSMYFIFQIMFDVRIELKKEIEKQKNISDIYHYEQVLDPPSMYN